MPNVTAVTNLIVTAQEGFTTTTSGTVSSGAATVGLNSVAGYTNGDIITHVIDPTDPAKKQAYTGVIDTTGVQITSVKWTEGTNQTHTAGATVVDYETATAWAMQAKLLKVAHNQDGSLIASAVDTAIVAGSIDTSQLANGSVTNVKLSTTAGEPGSAWQTWTPTLTNLTLGNGTLTAKHIQIGKTDFYHFTFVFGSTSSVGTAPTFTLPVTAASYGQSGTGEPTIGDVRFEDTGSGAIRGTASLKSGGTVVSLLIDNTAGTYSTMQSVTATAPFVMGTGDSILVTGMFEVA